MIPGFRPNRHEETPWLLPHPLLKFILPDSKES